MEIVIKLGVGRFAYLNTGLVCSDDGLSIHNGSSVSLPAPKDKATSSIPYWPTVMTHHYQLKFYPRLNHGINCRLHKMKPILTSIAFIEPSQFNTNKGLKNQSCFITLSL